MLNYSGIVAESTEGPFFPSIFFYNQCVIRAMHNLTLVQTCGDPKLTIKIIILTVQVSTCKMCTHTWQWQVSAVTVKLLFTTITLLLSTRRFTGMEEVSNVISAALHASRYLNSLTNYCILSG